MTYFCWKSSLWRIIWESINEIGTQIIHNILVTITQKLDRLQVIDFFVDIFICYSHNTVNKPVELLLHGPRSRQQRLTNLQQIKLTSMWRYNATLMLIPCINFWLLTFHTTIALWLPNSVILNWLQTSNNHTTPVP